MTCCARASTFHALGLQILKAERAALGFRGGFTVYDGADQLGTVRECLRQVSLDGDRRFDAKAILSRISRAKNAFIAPDEYAKNSGAGRTRRGDDYDAVTAEVYPRYQAALRAFHAVDFDDLIVETVRLLDRDAGVRDRPPVPGAVVLRNQAAASPSAQRGRRHTGLVRRLLERDRRPHKARCGYSSSTNAR